MIPLLHVQCWDSANNFSFGELFGNLHDDGVSGACDVRFLLNQVCTESNSLTGDGRTEFPGALKRTMHIR